MRRVGLVLGAALLACGLTTTPAMAAPGPPDHPEWWFDTWNVPGLWAGGARGQGITIGEIDTGVNASLPELSSNVAQGTDFGSFGGNGQVDRDTDDFGHGTAMASLMVAHDGEDNILGIAPDARVLPIAVPITGTTDDAGDDAGDLLLKAIRWAADHGAKIISMSLGAPRGPNDTGRSCPAEEQTAIDYALSKGDIVVASGGNSGDNGSPVEEPSVCLGVVSVGAVDQSNKVPDWSSKHPYLTVSAPGVGVPTISRVPGEAFFGDGTSQAAALTSGGLAVIWSKYPQLTNRQVVARLLATVDFRQTKRDPGSGFGVINIGSAVNASVPTDAPNPVFDAVAPFLAQDKAVAAAAPDPKVRRATSRTKLPGRYAVAPAPNPLTSGEGLAGLVGAAVGLVAMAMLIIGATRRRRLVMVGVVDPITEPIPMGPAWAGAGPVTAGGPESEVESPPAAIGGPGSRAWGGDSLRAAPEAASGGPESAAVSPARPASVTADPSPISTEPAPAAEVESVTAPETPRSVDSPEVPGMSHGESSVPEALAAAVGIASPVIPEPDPSARASVDSPERPAESFGESSAPAAIPGASGEVDSPESPAAPPGESSVPVVLAEPSVVAGPVASDSSAGSGPASAGAVNSPEDSAQPLGESTAPETNPLPSTPTDPTGDERN